MYKFLNEKFVDIHTLDYEFVIGGIFYFKEKPIGAISIVRTPSSKYLTIYPYVLQKYRKEKIDLKIFEVLKKELNRPISDFYIKKKFHKNEIRNALKSKFSLGSGKNIIEKYFK